MGAPQLRQLTPLFPSATRALGRCSGDRSCAAGWRGTAVASVCLHCLSVCTLGCHRNKLWEQPPSPSQPLAKGVTGESATNLCSMPRLQTDMQHSLKCRSSFAAIWSMRLLLPAKARTCPLLRQDGDGDRVLSLAMAMEGDPTVPTKPLKTHAGCRET